MSSLQHKISFQFCNTSTQNFMESQTEQSFYYQSFFEEPNSQDLFQELQLDPVEQDSIFDLSPCLEFPDATNKFLRILPTIPKKLLKNKQSLQNNENKNHNKLKSFRNTKNIKKRTVLKSEITKNVCYNIVQKTISVIKKGEYNEKLQEICKRLQTKMKNFWVFILKQKNKFTGPKALEQFLSVKNANHEIFRQFLDWFLREKYIRHAIDQGEMLNLNAYIKFKNEVILPLL